MFTVRFSPLTIAVALMVGGCTSPDGPTKSTGSTHVSGTVTSRVDSSPVDGSTIEFSGSSSHGTASVVGGHYAVDGLTAGAYVTTIKGPAHVDHSSSVDLGGSDSVVDFSVLTWNAQKFGVKYDQAFHQFFNQIGRGWPDRSPVTTLKWNRSPEAIYVVDQGISSPALDDFLALLDEVNRESLPDMFGGTAVPVPITTGPMPSSTWIPGTIVVTFKAGTGNTGQMGCGSVNGGVSCGLVAIALAAFDPISVQYPRNQRKYYILHEMLHAAGGGHVYANPGADYAVQNDSVMGTGLTRGSPGQTLAPVDKLAMWLVYAPGTKSGNAFPDTNPR